MGLLSCMVAMLGHTPYQAWAQSGPVPGLKKPGCDFNPVQQGQYIYNSPAGNFVNNGNCFRTNAGGTGLRGAIWYNGAINLNQPFDYTFNLMLGCFDNGADGMAFVLQNFGTTNQGGPGGGLGYQGIPGNYVAIEFDTFENGGAPNNDPACDHAATVVNGNVANPLNSVAPGIAGQRPCLPGGNAENCQYRTVRIRWNPNTNVFRMDYNGTAVLYHNFDIRTAFPDPTKVYFGWTGSTGSSVNTQEVCFPDNLPAVIPPSPVANPATNVTCTSFQANWLPTDAAATYRVEVSTDPNNFSNPVAVQQGLFNTFTNFSGLTGNNSYYYRVLASTACSPATLSPASNVVLGLGPKGPTAFGPITGNGTPAGIEACPFENVNLALTQVVGNPPGTNWFWWIGNADANPFVTGNWEYLLQGNQNQTAFTFDVPNNLSPTQLFRDIIVHSNWIDNCGRTGPGETFTIRVRAARPGTISSASVCQTPGVITITAGTPADAQPGATLGIQWFRSADGGNTYTYLSANDNQQSITDAPGVGNYIYLKRAFDNRCGPCVGDIPNNQFACRDVIVNVSVLANPSFSILPPGGDPNKCSNNPNYLLTASDPNLTYTWVPAAGLSSTTGQVVTFTETAEGTYTYTVTGTNAAGCTGTSEITLNVYPTPTVTVTAPALTNNFICPNNSTNLVANPGPNTIPVIYDWQPGNGTTPNFSVAPPGQNTTATYTLTITDINGCTASSTITLNIRPEPAVDVVANPANNAICLGQSVTLTATPQPGSDIVDYQWQANPTLGALPNSSLITVSPTQQTQFTLKSTDVNGCVTTDFITIAVNPLPTASISGTTTVCFGGTTSLTGLPNGLNAYNWQGPSGFAAGTQTINGVGSGTYTLTVTDANGCTDTETATVVSVPSFTPTISSNPANGFACSPQQVVLTADPGFTGTALYSWSGPNGYTANSQTISLTAAQAGSYTVQVTDALGCFNTSAPFVVTAGVQPQAQITGTPSFCTGSSTQLTVSPNQPTIQWVGPNGFAANTQTIAANQPGTYTVTVTEALGCTNSATITVTENPLPSSSITLSGSNVTCEQVNGTITIQNAENGVSYQLFNGATPVGSPVVGTGADIVYTIPATSLSVGSNTFTVQATVGSTGCQIQLTASAVITVTPAPPVVQIGGVSNTSVCLGGTATVAVSGTQNGLTYQVLNAGGAVLGQAPGTGGNITISVPAGALNIGANNVVLATNDPGTTCTSVNNLPFVITVNNPPATAIPVAAVNSPVCADLPLNITVGNASTGSSNGVNYTVFNGPTAISSAVAGNGGIITLTVPGSTLAAGTYTLTVQAELASTPGCTVTLLNDAQVTVLPLANTVTVTASATQSTVCDGTDAEITLTNTQTGVTYQVLNGAGVVISTVAGTGGNVTVPVPDAQLSVGGPNTFTINAVVDLTGCDVVLPNSVSFTVTPGPTLAPAQAPAPVTVCQGQNGIATVGVSTQVPQLTYQIQDQAGNALSPVLPGTGGNLDLSFNTAALIPGANTVTLVVTDVLTGCITTAPVSVTLVLAPATSLTVTANVSQICQNLPIEVTIAGTALNPTTTYQVFVGTTAVSNALPGTGGSIVLTIPANTLQPGTNVLTVVATNSANCSATQTQTVSVDVLPLPPTGNLTVSATSAAFCAGTQAVVTVSPTLPGVTYELLDSTQTPIAGTVFPGNGNQLFIPIPGSALLPGNNQIFVRPTIVQTGCSTANLTPTIVKVSVPPSTANLLLEAPSVCEGDFGTITVQTFSTLGTLYQVFTVGGVPVDVPVPNDPSNTGTNGDLVLTVPPAFLPVGFPFAEHQFVVSIIDPVTGCQSVTSQTVTIRVNPLPSANIISVDTTGCEGLDITYRLIDAAVDVNYQTQTLAGVNVGQPVHGTNGDDIFITVPASALVPGSNTFQILAVSDSGCKRILAKNLVITVFANPTDFVSTAPAAPICLGQDGTVQLTTSDLSVGYSVLDSTGAVVSGPTTGTGAALGLPVPAASLLVGLNTFTVTATNQSTTCTTTFPTVYRIFVKPLPNPDAQVDPETTLVCTANDAQVRIRLTSLVQTYQIFSGTTPVSNVVAGTGGDVFITIPAGALPANGIVNFTLRATDTQTGCTSSSTLPIVVDVIPYPFTGFIVNAGPAVCRGEATYVSVLNPGGNPVTSYQLFNGTTPIGSPVEVNTPLDSIRLDVPANSLPDGTNTLTVVATTRGLCSVSLTNTAQITIHPLPVVDLQPVRKVVCLGEPANVVLPNTQIGVQYDVLDANGNVVVDDLDGTGGDVVLNIPASAFSSTAPGTYTFSLFGTFVATQCTARSASAFIEVVVNAIPARPTVATQAQICEFGDATLLITDVPAAQQYFVYDSTLTNAPIPVVGGVFVLPNLVRDTVVYIEARNEACAFGAETRTRVFIDVKELPELKVRAFNTRGDEIVDTTIRLSIPRADLFLHHSSELTTEYMVIWGDGDSTARKPFIQSRGEIVNKDTHRYALPGVYVVKIVGYNEIGCPDTLYRTFVVGDVLAQAFPNAFSPNGDGLNDRLVYDLVGWDTHTIFIFDRWGRQVFTNNGDLTRFWDGRNTDGAVLPEGVYTYRIDAFQRRNNLNRSWSGTVTLVR
jgi:gliding motility-associated-like protein